MSTNGEQKRYAFEADSVSGRGQPPSRRTHRDAEKALAVLRSRLDVPEGAELDREVSRALLRFCTDVVLNISWYESARRREESSNRWKTRGIVALMVLALALLFASSMLPAFRGGSDASPGMLQLTLFAGGALTVLQVIAALGDGKTRLTIFWKASADLKELLYTFEQKWCGKALAPSQDGALGPTAGFVDAIDEALRSARAITRAERLDFFATVRSPSDVAAIAANAAESIRGRRAPSSAVAAQHEAAIAEARRALAAARAAVAASEFRMSALPQGPARDGENIVLVNARSEVVKAEKLLHDLSAV